MINLLFKDKNKIKIKKYSFYAFVKNLEKALMIAVMEITNDQIKGMKIGIGKTEKFSMKIIDFENLIVYGIIELAQIAPKDIRDDLRKNYDKLVDNSEN